MTSDPSVIVERLGALFAESFHIEVPAPDTDLLESGLLDSFQFVELLAQLERQFGLHLRIEDIELDDLRTLGRIARMISVSIAAPKAA